MNTCHTRMFFSCARGSRCASCNMSCLSLVIRSHPCFTAPCLTHCCFHSSLHLFWHRHPVLMTTPRCFSFNEFDRCHPQGGLTLAAWPKKALSQVTSPRPSLKSAASTHRQFTFEKKSSLDTDLGGLATSAAASKARQMLDS